MMMLNETSVAKSSLVEFTQLNSIISGQFSKNRPKHNECCFGLLAITDSPDKFGTAGKEIILRFGYTTRFSHHEHLVFPYITPLLYLAILSFSLLSLILSFKDKAKTENRICGPFIRIGKVRIREMISGVHLRSYKNFLIVKAYRMFLRFGYL
ncbi:hypothetical protein L6164_004767 [Bauhinia variegata]|uniref:Uncharacterized protein n=1 Tax=Bauhinia variegata TaxID=167791 RepID=A0ACB9PR59_BAUVA|nr:hypothetical protein L6164_004767 [Bauhinia variegata]